MTLTEFKVGRSFVPDPLPASFDLKADTYAAVIDAAAAMARADQASSLLPNPGLLARPATLREAVSTSALEGTYAFLSDVSALSFLAISTAADSASGSHSAVAG
ncbi:Fic/DOC family N-terminal domain-containing protein [Mycobacterium sp. NPDC003449]